MVNATPPCAQHLVFCDTMYECDEDEVVYGTCHKCKQTVPVILADGTDAPGVKFTDNGQPTVTELVGPL